MLSQKLNWNENNYENMRKQVQKTAIVLFMDSTFLTRNYISVQLGQAIFSCQQQLHIYHSP